MKYYGLIKVFLPFLVGYSLSSIQADSLAIPGTQPLHVNIYNNHHLANDQASQMQTNTTAAAHSQAFAQQTNSLLLYFQQQLSPEKFQALKQEALKAQTKFIEYAKQNKCNIAFSMLGSCYAYIWFQLLYYAHHILKDDTWSCWKGTIPFEMLKIIPEQELGKELVFAAQEKYQKPDTLSDLLTPLVYFLRDVERESKNLESFINLHSWLNTLQLAWFFPQQKKLLELAQVKYDRVTFLKNVFIRWVTDYKLAINRSPESEVEN